MVAVLEETPTEEIVAGESIEDALAEVTRKYVIADAARHTLWCRREELLFGARAERRKRARSALDAYLPPITFFGIDEVSKPEPEIPLRRAPGLLISALAEVCVIWWKKFFSRRGRH